MTRANHIGILTEVIEEASDHSANSHRAQRDAFGLSALFGARQDDELIVDAFGDANDRAKIGRIRETPIGKSASWHSLVLRPPEPVVILSACGQGVVDLHDFFSFIHWPRR
jgi:hypothetical protein